MNKKIETTQLILAIVGILAFVVMVAGGWGGYIDTSTSGGGMTGAVYNHEDSPKEIALGKKLFKYGGITLVIVIILYNVLGRYNK